MNRRMLLVSAAFLALSLVACADGPTTPESEVVGSRPQASLVIQCDPNVDPGCMDADFDGVLDFNDNCPGYPNADQRDDDNDGVGNACDPCPTDPSNDADGDGICGDVDNCPGGDDLQDSDGDGIPDACDPCPTDPSNDADGDGVCADTDNCPLTANSDQQDSDGDGVGDACDTATFEQVLEQLGRDVAALPLNRGQINSLMVKLAAAGRSAAEGRSDTARNQLEAFRNEVNALVASGRLTPLQGRSLVLSAQELESLLP